MHTIEGLKQQVEINPTRQVANNWYLFLIALAGMTDLAYDAEMFVSNDKAQRVGIYDLEARFKALRIQQPELIQQIRAAFHPKDYVQLNQLLVGPVYDALLMHGIDSTIFAG